MTAEGAHRPGQERMRGRAVEPARVPAGEEKGAIGRARAEAALAAGRAIRALRPDPLPDWRRGTVQPAGVSPT